MLTAIFFLITVSTGYLFSLFKGPIWGLIAYITVYFFFPDANANWWAEYLPDLRWSLLSTGILLVSIFIHRDKLSTHKVTPIYYFILTLLVIIEVERFTVAVSKIDAGFYSYNMLGYCVIIFLIIKILAKFEHLRLFILSIIFLCAYTGLQSYTDGRFIDGRVNDIGPGDAHGANEIGILLGSVMPFIIPFIVRGKRYEKIICLLSLPLIINGFTLTVSRGAIVALFSGIFYAFFLVADKNQKKYILIAIVCVLPVFMFFTDDSYKNRISTLWLAERNNEEALNELSSGRTAIWTYGLKMLKDYPFGAGPGGFREIARFYMPKEILVFNPGFEYGVRAAHNSYLLVMVELGYLGLICYLIICAATVYFLFISSKKIKNTGNPGTFVDLLTMSLNISFICTLAGGMFSSRFYYEFFWWQIAMVIVLKSFVINNEDKNILLLK